MQVVEQTPPDSNKSIRVTSKRKTPGSNDSIQLMDLSSSPRQQVEPRRLSFDSGSGVEVISDDDEPMEPPTKKFKF